MTQKLYEKRDITDTNTIILGGVKIVNKRNEVAKPLFGIDFMPNRSFGVAIYREL